MVEELKKSVCEANIGLESHGLVISTWGNVSGYDPEKELMVIKPSGVPYCELTPGKMVVVDLKGHVAEGKLKPSSDTPTHLVLYRKFRKLGGIVHTHSKWATTWAQAGVSIPPLGTTHADYFYGEIPCTHKMTETEVTREYEAETGHVIVRTMANMDPLKVPAILVRSHGPFCFGRTPHEALTNSVVLEHVAEMAYHTLALNQTKSIEDFLLDKHYLRRHGKRAYYGQ